MKQFAIAFAMLCTLGWFANEAQAQHFHYGGRGYGQIHRPVRSTGFSISVGNGFNGFSYNNFRGVPGGFAPVYRAPVYRPVYGAPAYGFGRPVYGSGLSIGIGGGGYGRGRSCGRW